MTMSVVMSWRRSCLTATVALGWIFLSANQPAIAQAPPYPTVNAFVDSALNFESGIADGEDPASQLYVFAEPSVQLEWWDGVFLTGVAEVSEFGTPAPGKVAFFRDQDILITDIDLTITNWVYTLQAGKFIQPIGLAPFQTPGFFGNEFANDYEFSELIGINGAYDFGHLIKDGAWGRQKVTVGTFFVDTSFLSQSAFGEVSRTRLSDGGPANTEDFSSFFITFDGVNVPIFNGVSYRVSYVYSAAGVGDTGNEEGITIGAVAPIPLSGTSALETARGNYVGLNVIGEYAHFKDFDGFAGADRNYYSAGAELWIGRWFGTGVATNRTVDGRALGVDNSDLLLAGSVGYSFPFRSIIQAAYAYEQVAGLDNHFIGIQFTHTFAITDIYTMWTDFGQPAVVLTNNQLR